jgi:hypothetical protein
MRMRSGDQEEVEEEGWRWGGGGGGWGGGGYDFVGTCGPVGCGRPAAARLPGAAALLPPARRPPKRPPARPACARAGRQGGRLVERSELACLPADVHKLEPHCTMRICSVQVFFARSRGPAPWGPQPLDQAPPAGPVGEAGSVPLFPAEDPPAGARACLAGPSCGFSCDPCTASHRPTYAWLA